MSLVVELGRAECSGEYKVVLRNSEGEITQESDWNNNLLLNTFFARTAPPPNEYCRVGTGSTPPAVTDIALTSPLGGVSASSTSTGSASVSGDASDGFVYETAYKVFKWTLGSIVGNIAEFVITDTISSSYTPFVRSLIKDTEGNPTTIAVTSSDQLEIWWKLKKKWIGSSQMTSVTQSRVLNGVTTDVTCKNINPSRFNTASGGRWSSAIFAKVISDGANPNGVPYCATVVASNAGSTALLGANAGDDVALLSLPTEQVVAGTEVITNPSAGVTKITMTYNFPLLPSAAASPMLAVILTNTQNSGIATSTVVALATFSPQFTKGVDKILTVSFSYSVTRAP